MKSKVFLKEFLPMDESVDIIEETVRDLEIGEGLMFSPLFDFKKVRETVETLEDAEKFLMEHVEDNLSVVYYDTSRFEPSATLQDMEFAYVNAEMAWYDAENANHFEGVKTEAFTCKGCGSKIATAYIKDNHCPCCGADMRPESALKSISSKKEKAEKYKSRFEARKEKEIGRFKCPKILWKFTGYEW